MQKEQQKLTKQRCPHSQRVFTVLSHLGNNSGTIPLGQQRTQAEYRFTDSELYWHCFLGTHLAKSKYPTYPSECSQHATGKGIQYNSHTWSLCTLHEIVVLHFIKGIYSLPGVSPGIHPEIYSLSAVSPGIHPEIYSLSGVSPGIHPEIYSLSGVSPGIHPVIYSLSGVSPGVHPAIYSLYGVSPGVHQAIYSLSGVIPGIHPEIYSLSGVSPGIHPVIYSLSGVSPGVHQAIYSLSRASPGIHPANWRGDSPDPYNHIW